MTMCERPVAVIRGCHPSTGTTTLTRNLFSAIGKQSVVVADSPRFVTDRVAALSVNEAICHLYDDPAAVARALSETLLDRPEPGR